MTRLHKHAVKLPATDISTRVSYLFVISLWTPCLRPVGAKIDGVQVLVDVGFILNLLDFLLSSIEPFMKQEEEEEEEDVGMIKESPQQRKQSRAKSKSHRCGTHADIY